MRVRQGLTNVMADLRRMPGAVTLGLLGSSLLMLGALTPSSPAVHHPASGWYASLPGPRDSHFGVLLSMAVLGAGLVLLSRGWLAVMRRSRHEDAPAPATLVWVFLLWSIPLLVAPPLGTRDIYSYVAQGEIQSRGLDPYEDAPGQLAPGEFFEEVDPRWRSAPSPYGPLFIVVAETAVEVTGHRLRPAVLFIRAATFLATLLLGLALIRLARVAGHSPTDAFAVAMLNPITMIHLVGGAHNEAFMLLFLVAGLVLALEGQPLIGVALCTIGSAFKSPAIAGAVFVGWHWMRTTPRMGAQVRRAAAVAIATAAVFVAASALPGAPLDWVTLGTTPTRVQSYLSPVTMTGVALSHVVALTGIPRRDILTFWQGLFLVVALAIAVRMLRRVPTIGVPRAVGLALLAVALLSPVLFPFYMLWGLVPLAAAGLRRERGVLVALSIILSPSLLPGGRTVIDAIEHLGPLWAVGGIALLLLLMTPRRLPGRERAAQPSVSSA